MPAVHDFLATINEVALARFHSVANWRAAASQASRSFLTGRAVAPVGPARSDPPESEYAHAGPEPLLDEVLEDPMVQLMMQADHVQAADMRRLLGSAHDHCDIGTEGVRAE
jgi:hypothetical protein